MADKNDTVAEGRFKMALEGIGFGLGVDAAISGLRGIKNKFKKAEEIEQKTETPLKTESKIDTATTLEQAKKERVDEFIPEGVAPEPKEGFAANVRLNKKLLDEDEENIIKNIANENEQFWNARRGRIRFGKEGEVLHEAALEKGWKIDDVLNLKQGTTLNVEDLAAVRKITADSQEEFADVTKIYNQKAQDGLLTDVDRIEYLKFADTTTALSAKESGVISEIGRSLGSMRMLSRSPNETIKKKALDEYLRKVKGTFEDPDVMAKNVAEFDNVDSAIDFLAKSKKTKALDYVQEAYLVHQHNW